MKREKHTTFTYSGKATTRRTAIRKAKKDGINFSELVESLLVQYNNYGIPLPADYVEFKNVGILKADGSVEKL